MESQKSATANKLSCGGYIRSLRMESGESLRKTSEALGISAPYLCDIEKDRRPLNLKMARLLVKHLKLSGLKPADMYNKLLKLSGLMTVERATLLEVYHTREWSKYTISEYQAIMEKMRVALYGEILS